MSDGKIRILTVVDELTRENLMHEVDFAFRLDG